MKNNKNRISLNTPASEWRDAWPTGNGQVGALVYGDVTNEKIIINHEDLWLYGEKLPLPDVSGSLKEVRNLMEKKEYSKAHNCHRDRLHESGYFPVMSDFSPLCTLEILDNNPYPVSLYRRDLNMENGEVSVNWQGGGYHFSRDFFVSRSSGKIYCQFKSSGTGQLNFNLSLSPLADNPDNSYCKAHGLEFSKETDSGSLSISGRDKRGFNFGAVVSIKRDGGSSTVENDVLQIRNSEMIQIEIEVFAGASDRLGADTFCDFDYSHELFKHKKLHGELYHRLNLELGGEGMKDVQKMFDYGRYLLISSTGSALPPNLQGLWNGDRHPIWNCFYMLNENIQMMHWLALPGNTPEMLLSLFEYYESRLDDFRENALKLFKCRGIFIPANTVPDTGVITDLQGHLIYWTAGAAWLCRFYYDYYLYTEDETFLRERALPIMKEAAAFYEDYTYVNERGEIEFNPSISPENAPEEFNRQHKMDANCNISINATMDIALCKELLTNLIEGSELCGLNDESIPVWRNIISKLPPYTVNEDGAICEWLHEGFSDNYHHRHVSHIYPFFPGREIAPGDEMVSPIKKAVDKRFEIGMKEQTGWSVVHLANIYARLGQGDRALECLEILKEYCTGENLFTYHNDWRERGVCEAKPKGFDKRVFQIDANMGYPAAILEMLIHSDRGVITLLPGVPSTMEEGRISGVKCRGNIQLDMKWSAESLSVQMLSQRDQSVHIRNGRRVSGEEILVELKAGLLYSMDINS
jgi:alpha-L-fucosidase 2